MSPRKYDMGKRAAAAAETRRRIVDATRALHAEQGIAGTSYDDIAARAGVGVGTVYRHFPSLDELIPACGRVVGSILALPAPGDAEAVFAGVEGEARIARLVDEAFGIYERGAPALRAVRREPDAHPAVRQTADALEASLGALVDAAVSPLGAGDEERRIVRGLLDLGTWDALRAQGVEPAPAVVALLTAAIRPPAARASRRASAA
jgi:AcrR family transcriptional regulator